MLELRNVNKSFGGLVATQDVSLTIEKESITSLIGPNGAGKTTLFAQISGFVVPDSGRIHFDEQSIVGVRPERICNLGIARTFQIVQPFSGLTVRENIAVGSHLHLGSRREALDYATTVGTKVGLGRVLEKAAGDLTIAGRKRLEVAKALATRPKLLLLDEVMAGLNPIEIDEIISIIRNIRSEGVTILLIEHVMRAVMNLSERILVLSNGRLIADGSCAEIVSNPAVIEAYLGKGAAGLSIKERADA
jgi:branched-chain amino acid transport system ATP-binding protein